MTVEKQYVIFELSGEIYGLEIASVESIIKLQPITMVPKTPDYVEGVTNLRGKVLPVIDLRKRFKTYEGEILKPADRGKDTRIIVLNIKGTMLGVIVDAVSEVLRVSEDLIEPLPDMTTAINGGFITGVAKLAEQLVILLDMSKLVSPLERERLDQMGEPSD